MTSSLSCLLESNGNVDSFQDVADGQGRNIKWKQLANMCAEAPPAQSTEQVTNGDHPEGELEDGGESSTFPFGQWQLS